MTIGSKVSHVSALAFSAALLAVTATAADAKCSQYGKVRSQASDTEVEVELVNRTNEPVFVYWIDYDGVLKPKEQLEPGQSKWHNSYVSHPFVIIDGDNRCRALTVVKASTRRVVAR